MLSNVLSNVNGPRATSLIELGISLGLPFSDILMLHNVTNYFQMMKTEDKTGEVQNIAFHLSCDRIRMR